MGFINTPLPKNISLRYVLARWGIDINNEEHMYVNPLEGFIKDKGLKLFFRYRGKALAETINGDWYQNDEIDQTYFKLDQLPFGRLIEINQTLSLVVSSINNDGVYVETYFYGYDYIYPIAPVSEETDNNGFQITLRNSEYYSLEDVLITDSSYYLDYRDPRLILDINNVKAFEQRYMNVDHDFSETELDCFLEVESKVRLAPIAEYNHIRDGLKQIRKRYVIEKAKNILPVRSQKEALLLIKEEILKEKPECFKSRNLKEKDYLPADSTVSGYLHSELGNKWWSKTFI